MVGLCNNFVSQVWVVHPAVAFKTETAEQQSGLNFQSPADRLYATTGHNAFLPWGVYNDNRAKSEARGFRIYTH